MCSLWTVLTRPVLPKNFASEGPWITLPERGQECPGGWGGGGEILVTPVSPKLLSSDGHCMHVRSHGKCSLRTALARSISSKLFSSEDHCTFLVPRICQFEGMGDIFHPCACVVMVTLVWSWIVEHSLKFCASLWLIFLYYAFRHKWYFLMSFCLLCYIR